MASQVEKVEEQESEKTEAQDTAEFAGAWDKLEAEESGQSAPAAEHQDAKAKKGAKTGEEAGQSEAEAGQPDADAPPDADADEASRGEISDDVPTGAEPTAEQRLAEEQKARRKAENLARANGGRLAKALNDLAALRKSLPDGGDAAKEGDTPTKDERIEKLRQDYPDVAEPLLDQMAKLEQRIETLTTTETARAESEVVDALAANFEALIARHSDVPTIVADPAYAEWVKGQTPAIQRIVAENSQAVVNADDAALVFDLYKASRGQGKTEAEKLAEAEAARRAEQLDAARGPTGAKPGVRSDLRTNDGTFGDAWDEFDRKDQQKAAQRR